MRAGISSLNSSSRRSGIEWTWENLGRLASPPPLWGREGVGGRADRRDWLAGRARRPATTDDGATPLLCPPPQGGRMRRFAGVGFGQLTPPRPPRSSATPQALASSRTLRI